MHPKCTGLSQQTILTLSEHSSKCGTNSKLALFSSMKFSQNLKKMSHFTLTTSHEHSLNLWDWMEPTYIVLVSWNFFKNCSKFSHFTITTNKDGANILEKCGTKWNLHCLFPWSFLEIWSFRTYINNTWCKMKITNLHLFGSMKFLKNEVSHTSK